MGKKKESKNRINKEISQFGKIHTVRLVGENVEAGIYDLNFAIKLAEDQGLDLVEISNGGNPPVCKVVDYQKYLYEQKKKEKENSKKQKTQKMKEIQLTPNTDDHDFNFKVRHAERFIKEDGDKVKLVVLFKGREITFTEKGQLILLKFADRLSEFATPEKMPNLEGRKMIMILKPKK